MSRCPSCVSSISCFRVKSLTDKKDAEASQLHMNDVFQEFTAIDTIIDRLKASIPSPDQIPRFDPEKARRLAVGYSMINAAILRLHRPFSTQSDTSRRKRLAAAQVILNIITVLKPGHPSSINPIMGVSYFLLLFSFKILNLNRIPLPFLSQTVWSEAAQVIFDEMTMLRSSFAPAPLDSSSGPGGTEEGALFDTVYQALLSMNDFCTYLPLLCTLQSAFPIFSLPWKLKPSW